MAVCPVRRCAASKEIELRSNLPMRVLIRTAIHFHGIHSASMDGIPGIGRGVINVGESFTYEFDAFPMGCHLYHCHAVPLKRHIHKGLYGAFIVDPDPTKYSGEEAEVAKSRNRQYEENKEFDEMVIVMNGFDTNFDGDNEIYAANTVGFHYHKHPIKISRNQKQRIYLINMTEFDPINSFHLHANFFDYYGPWHDLDADFANCRHNRSMPSRKGASSSSRMPDSSRDSTCFTPIRASSPSSVG